MTDYPSGIAETLVVHIAAGGIGLATGYVALYAPKGERVHRASGRLYVYAMTVMGLTGAAIGAFGGAEISAFAGLVTAYLVVTALTTVRPRTERVRQLDRVAGTLGVVIGIASLSLGIHTILSPTGLRDGLPAFPFFIMGLPALFGGLADLRMLRRDAPRGAPRIARHLWRMCYALLIAAMSFFFGQADELPAVLRAPVLLATPVVAVLVTLLYWIWRVRARALTAGGVAGKVRHGGHHHEAREQGRHVDGDGIRRPATGAGDPHGLPR